MNINDETLSAFLDAELPEAEMEQIRTRIAEDENLANRLAELAGVDSQLQACYQTIDNQPMPTAITEMIAASAQQKVAETSNNAAQKSAKIFRFPSFSPQHLAMAASVTLAIGIAMNYWLAVEPNQGGNWQEVAHALDTLPSGETLQLGASSLTTKVSFTNQEGELCRQYEAHSAANITQGIACRRTNTWQPVATITLANKEAATGSQYQTASNNTAIVELVDTMAVGSFLNRTQEAKAIASGWSNNPQATDK